MTITAQYETDLLPVAFGWTVPSTLLWFHWSLSVAVAATRMIQQRLVRRRLALEFLALKIQPSDTLKLRSW